MKNIIITSLAVFTIFTFTLMQSCKNDPCTNISCAYSGVCQSGLCKCQVGYEGIHCETVMRDKFIGIYNVNEDGTLTSPAQYVANIQAGDYINQVKMYNVLNKEPFKSNPVIASVVHDTITITNQTMPDGSKIEGWGFVRGTNSLDQHYYQHSTVSFFYMITSPVGQQNKYGYPDDGTPSIWSK